MRFIKDRKNAIHEIKIFLICSILTIIIILILMFYNLN